MGLFGDFTDITDGIDAKIWQAIDKSIDKNNLESFRKLNAFVSQVLILSLRNNSFKHFQKYINFKAYYYSVSFEKATRNSALAQIHKSCSEQAAIDLKQIIWFDIGYISRSNQSIDNIKSANKFYYMAFLGFSKLLYYMLKNGDINQFRFAMDLFDEISISNYNDHYKIKWEIRDLERENINGDNDIVIKEKKDELRILKEFDNYKRHVLTGIKYWVFYLFKLNRINEEIALLFIERIKIPNAESEDLLNDILFFRSSSMNYYMEWSEWDFIVRPSGRIYSPPIPYEWLTFGFFADQLREKRFFVNVKDLDSKEISYANLLYDSLKSIVKIFEEDFEKWKVILTLKNREELSSKTDEILKDFAIVKRKSLTDKDKAIALSPIYQPHVDNFKTLIGNAWKSQARIHNMFRKYENLICIDDANIKLKQIGQITFFEKAKMMFTEQNYQMIYGIERMGSEVANWEDNYFFSIISQTEFNKISGSSIFEVLSEAILELKKKNIEPNVIIVPNVYSYKDEKFLRSDRFISIFNTSQQNNVLASFCIGTFDGIEVFTSYSPLLNNSVLVSNFNKAFQMKYIKNDEYFDDVLKVNVSEVSHEEALRHLEENRIKWTTIEDGGVLSDTEALMLIKTSVIIEIGTNIEFEILNNEAYIIGYIKSESFE